MNLQQKLDELAPIINEIRNDAHALHASVNHAYDRIRPYGFHLDMVVNWVRKYIECQAPGRVSTGLLAIN